jgi:hypothetical protein
MMEQQQQRCSKLLLLLLEPCSVYQSAMLARRCTLRYGIGIARGFVRQLSKQAQFNAVVLS